MLVAQFGEQFWLVSGAEHSRGLVKDEGNDDEDSSLRELIRICEALTRPPNQGKLKKSKSMVKKSKSMIMTAKDIPMNAFMAMKVHYFLRETDLQFFTRFDLRCLIQLFF